MNAFAEAGEALNWLLNASLQAALLVPVILLAQWLLRHRLSARWRFALWWLLILRLLLPVSFASPWSIFNYVQPQVNLAGPQVSPPPTADMETVAPSVVSESVPVRLANNDSPPITASVPAEIPQTVRPVEPSPATPLVAVEPAEVVQPDTWRRGWGADDYLIPLIWAAWFLVALGLTVAATLQSIAFSRRLRASRQNAPAPLNDLLAECRRIMGIRRDVALLETEAVTSPVLYGLFRLRILLPWGFAGRFSPAELRHVLLHELAHVKRRDLWLNWLVIALQIVHWFNPLVWLGFARLRADRELACDELALLRSGADTGRDYGRTMLKLLEDFARPKSMPGLVGILEDKQQMQRRVRMIARFKRPSRWSALALIPITALGLVLLTDAQVPIAEPAGAAVRENDNATLDGAGLLAQDQSPLFGPDNLASSFFGPIEEQPKAWTGRLLEGLRLECHPDRSRYALGDEIVLRCTITNTSEREHRINWHPTAGDRFILRGEPPVLQMLSTTPRPHWLRERGGELPYFAPVDVRSPVRIEKKPGTPSSEIILPARTSVKLIHRRTAKQTGTFRWILAYEAFIPAIVTQETMELLDSLTLISEPFKYEVTESDVDAGSVETSPAPPTPDHQNFIVLEGGAPSHGLDLYRELTGLELVISPHVTNVLSLLSLGPLAGDKEKLSEEIVIALREQCGLIITRIDERRASVTYNEALAVKPVPAPEDRKPTPLGPDGGSTAKLPPSPPRPPSNDPGSVESSAPTSGVRKPIFELRLVESEASDDTTLSVLTQPGKEAPANLQKLFVRKEPLLDTTAIASAYVGKNEFTGRPDINLEFTAEGRVQFAEVTRAHVDRQLAFVIDGQVVSAPVIAQPITGGRAIISGSFTREEVERLAQLINEHVARKSAGVTPYTGTIRGRVILEGKPPPEREITVMDAHSRAQHTSTPTTQFYVVADDGGLRDVVVYLEGDLPPLASAADLPPLIIDHQRGFKVPYISALAVGQTLLLTNSDAQLHNCHITPPPGSLNREVNKAMMRGVASPHTFTAPDHWVRLKCDVHPWEFAYVCVFPHRYFAVTDATGRFSLTNMPPGRYKLNAIHRKALGDGPVEVEIVDGELKELRISLRPESIRASAASPDNTFVFDLASPSHALDVYRQLTGLDLVVSSQVTNVAAFVSSESIRGSPMELAKAIERLLREQTGLVITKLDDKRASVTFNEALPVKPVAAPNDLRPVPLGPDGNAIIKPQPRVPRPGTNRERSQ